MFDMPCEKSSAPCEGDSRTFLMIFTIGFVVLFAVASLAQMLGMHWRTWLPGAENMKTISAGVKAGVYTFMSHIN